MNKERSKKTERSKNVGPPSESHTENREIENDADCQATLEGLLERHGLAFWKALLSLVQIYGHCVPTRDELLQLVKYWSEVKLNEDWFYFCYRQIDCSSIRLKDFARCRIGKIARLLGEEEVVKVIDEVYAEFGKQKDHKLWDIFLNGDEKQWEAVSEETWRKAEKYFRSREKGGCPENE